MPLHVESQVVGAGEAAAAVVTLERLGSRVFPEVTGEFVGASEPPLTAFPRTPVRLFTGVCTLVGLEVRGLGVHFLAAGEETLVYPTFGVRRSVCRPRMYAHTHPSHAHSQTTAVAVTRLEGQGGGEGDKLWHL